MRFCSNCGNQISENAQFCGTCGVRMETATNLNQQYNTTQYSNDLYQQQNYNNVAPKKLGGVLALSIVAIFFSFVFGLISLSYYFQAKKAETEQAFKKAVKTSKIMAFVGIGIGVLMTIMALLGVA